MYDPQTLVIGSMLQLGAHTLQTSSYLDSKVVYTWNTPHNHDLHIAYIHTYSLAARYTSY